MKPIELNTFIGLKIREYRRAKKLTQEQVAEAIDLSLASMVNIERGRQSCTSINLYQIASILEINISDIFPEPKGFEVRTEEVIIVKKIKSVIVKNYDIDQ